jgi:hypothetical protein
LGVKPLQKLRICGWELVVMQLLTCDPTKIRTTELLWFAPSPLTAKKLEKNGFLGIGVCDRLNQFAHRNFNPQFFPQLALEAIGEILAGVALAAREFPQAAEMGFWITLRDEKLALVKDQTSSDFDNGLLAHESLGIGYEGRPMLL